MKYLKQIGIILGITFIGEILNYLIPLPIPASIYGMAILFVARAPIMTMMLNVRFRKNTTARFSPAFL